MYCNSSGTNGFSPWSFNKFKKSLLKSFYYSHKELKGIRKVRKELSFNTILFELCAILCVLCEK